jgi:5-hydroxyisourate hydrolase
MSGISTHVLDLTRGTPAAGVMVRLSRLADEVWTEIAVLATDEDGRVRALPGEGMALTRGQYRLHFETGEYFHRRGGSGFHPYIEVVFEIADPAENYHVPLLLTPFGYSTYRGS